MTGREIVEARRADELTRAWRQGLYAVLVLGGTLFGLRWGLHGVALGVLAALVVHYAVSNHLSMKLTQTRLNELVQAIFPAARLAIVTYAVTAGVALLAKRLEIEALPTVAMAAGATVAVWTAMMWPSPRYTLGEDGLAAARSLRRFVRESLSSTASPSNGG